MQTGVGIFEYWDMTWAEIEIILQAHKREIVLQQKQRAIMDHAMIGMLGRMLDGKKVSLYESYPSLFEQEQQQQTLENAKQQLLRMAASRKKGGMK